MRPFTSYGPSLIVLITAMLVLFLGPRVVRSLTYEQTRIEVQQASLRLGANGILAELNQGFLDVASAVQPSVVHISTEQVLPRRTALSSGSGWVWDNDGHIVTNHHVVRDAVNIEVQLSTGELRDAVVVDSDDTTDIAVIRVGPGGLHPATRITSDERVLQGQLVFAFGSPFDFRRSMSAGIVSGKGRSVDVLPGGYENFIQVDAAINPGNSGGPLADHLGRVVGMNTAIATGRSNPMDEGQFAGIGLAIPMSMIEPVVRQIIDGGGVKKGLLGLTPRDLDVRDAQRSYGFIGEGGAEVAEVSAGLPAAAAGVRVRDIITEVNGEAVGSAAQLRSLISSRLPGERVELQIFRPDVRAGDGERLTIMVDLDMLVKLRDWGELPKDQPLDRVPLLGLDRITTSSPEAAADAGVPYQPGVLIQSIVAGSRLEQVAEPGTIIVAVDDVPVRSVEDFYAGLRLRSLLRGARISLLRPDGQLMPFLLRVE